MKGNTSDIASGTRKSTHGKYIIIFVDQYHAFACEVPSCVEQVHDRLERKEETQNRGGPNRHQDQAQRTRQNEWVISKGKRESGMHEALLMRDPKPQQTVEIEQHISFDEILLCIYCPVVLLTRKSIVMNKIQFLES